MYCKPKYRTILLCRLYFVFKFYSQSEATFLNTKPRLIFYLVHVFTCESKLREWGQVVRGESSQVWGELCQAKCGASCLKCGARSLGRIVLGASCLAFTGPTLKSGMANGKIRDSPRRRDLCLKIRDRDLKVLTKSEPETLWTLKKTEPETSLACFENCSQRDMSYTIFDKSRVSKCYAMTTNLRLKIPTCHAYIFERLLSYVFNRINNFIMVLMETVGQKTNIGDSESSRPKIRESETQRNKRKRDFETHSKRLRDFANSRLEEKFPRP